MKRRRLTYCSWHFWGITLLVGIAAFLGEHIGKAYNHPSLGAALGGATGGYFARKLRRHQEDMPWWTR